MFESCAAEHLALELLDPVDIAFDDTGVPRLGETGDDGFAGDRAGRGRPGFDRLRLAAQSGAGVGADVAVVVRVALFLDLFPEHPGVGAAFLPSLIQVGLIGIELCAAVLPLAGGMVFRCGGAGEAQDGVETHAELSGDGPLAVSGGEERVHGGVFGPCACSANWWPVDQGDDDAVAVSS
ncbi:hypothetical protein [Streptomyces mirabilis]|uniref:hypothetical protein n=1 Tax=Streptomyces mirabilis TaxID=68239 RepID=UPI0033BF2307